MKYKFLIYSLFFSLTAFCQDNRHIVFEDTRIDSTINKLDSILIVGVGSISTRIFLDNLSARVIKRFGSKGIKCQYRYLGESIAEAKEAFKLIPTKDSDAILLFLPKDSSLFEIKTETKIMPNYNPNFPFGMGIGIYTITTLPYHQDFNIQLFFNGEKKKMLWKALLKVNCDITDLPICSSISNDIFSCFKEYKYIK